MTREDRRHLHVAAALAAIALASACASAPGKGSSSAPSRPTALLWMNASAEYRAAAAAAFAEATRAVEARAAGRPAGSWAVIVDADETVLSNVAYLRGLERRGDEDSDEAWTQWVKRRAAVPLPGALAFLGRVRELGGRIAVVTNREHGECEDTIANLREKAVPFDVV
ncbi:MAG TPA: HAD family acid phosphatase, partial [Vicinamibacteria bacterium]